MGDTEYLASVIAYGNKPLQEIGHNSLIGFIECCIHFIEKEKRTLSADRSNLLFGKPFSEIRKNTLRVKKPRHGYQHCTQVSWHRTTTATTKDLTDLRGVGSHKFLKRRKQANKRASFRERDRLMSPLTKGFVQKALPRLRKQALQESADPLTTDSVDLPSADLHHV